MISKLEMAGRSGYNKYKNKKKTKGYKYKKSGGARPNSVVNRVVFGHGLPKMCIVTHRYVDSKVLNMSAGVTSTFTFKCNGMFDPDYTGTGHQPLYFDQLSALYNHYCVIGSKITIRFAGTVATAGGNSVPIVACLQTHPAASPTYTDPLNAAEQNYSHFKLMGPGQDTNVIMGAKWSAKKFFGAGVLANDELKGTPSSDPAELSYFSIGARPMDSLTNCSCQLIVTIEYIAVWKELKNITSS